MRYAELTFLVLLAAYHAVLLVPRHRRFFPANYLVFLTGMALAWNLGLEGLRWQTLPPALLLLLDMAVLFPTFRTLRGLYPRPGFWSALGRLLRSLIASGAFLLVAGSLLLAVAFPLPKVELSGGLSPAHRTVRFAAQGGEPGLVLRLWYPASGDLRPDLRWISKAETWARNELDGGVPAFWSSHLEFLPTPLIQGGKLAAAGTKYPVILVSLPEAWSPELFGTVFEDLASRGFVVAASTPVNPPLAPAPAFDLARAWKDSLAPWLNPARWLQPEARWALAAPGSALSLERTRTALRQVEAEPGDLLFGGLDWSRQGLWVWGADTPGTGWKAVLHAGGRPADGARPAAPELWISPGAAPRAQPNRWVLSLASLHPADLADSAYLKPYLILAGLKSQADAGFHGALRQYSAAFFQYAFWNATSGTSYSQTVPQVTGLVLSGP